jgi:hypothetical protein
MVARRIDVRPFAALGAVGVIWSIAFWATRQWPDKPPVAIGAAFDASITSAIAMYLIAVRPGRLPRWAITLTITLGLAYARAVLAIGGTKHVVMMTAMALELAVTVFIIVRIRRARAAWRVSRAAGAAPIDALRDAIVGVGMPARLAAAVAIELGLFALLVTGWKRPVRSPALFTVHRVNGWFLYLGVFVFLTIVEAGGLHLVLVHYDWSKAAWISTILSLYSIAWLVGDAHALRHGGVTLGDTGIALRIGMRWRGDIAWSNVRDATRVDATPDGAVNASVLGGNVVLELAEPVTLTGLFGRKRTGVRIALSIDEPERFVAAVRRTP